MMFVSLWGVYKLYVLKNADDVILDYDDNEDKAIERAYVLELLMNEKIKIVKEDYNPEA